MAGVDLESRQLISDLLKLASPGANSQNKVAGMKTTPIAGYPAVCCWAMWVGAEVNDKGVTKATLCLPYFQNSMVAMTKFSGATSLETPLDMVASEIINPYNCKLGVTPGLDLNKLISGEIYYFLLAIKPAGFNQSGNVTSYWDGAIKAFGNKANPVFNDYFELFKATAAQWAMHKKSLETASLRDADDDYQDLSADGTTHQ
ncbi:MAG TPA: hypothetical protein VLA84_14445 [Microcoleus sp.]|nr:hypothetical protein [Microcoleus sp.]